MRHRLLVVIILTFFPLASIAQKTRIASGEYIYYVPETITLEKAKQIALERAQVKIIADEFGTIIGSFSSTRIKSNGFHSDIDFITLGDSEVKGEWIETIGEPSYEITYDNNLLVVRVSVKGKIREIATAPIDFEARVLCNGTEDKFERYDFNDGDDLYLSFTSPISGFLTIYLFDGHENVYCLLPYYHQTDGIVQVDAGKRYVFFSLDCASNEPEKRFVDEYVMTSEKSQELNKIYIIFSPNQFYKAVDIENTNTYSLPRQLGYQNFQKWLVKNRKIDKEMRLEVKNITINKKR